ncbi:MAG: helix-turn-helix domain-containing protein, partial [Sedimenticolaceae bacterium]
RSIRSDAAIGVINAAAVPFLRVDRCFPDPATYGSRKREHIDSIAYSRVMADPVMNDPVDSIRSDFGDDVCPIAVVVAGGERGAAAPVGRVPEVSGQRPRIRPADLLLWSVMSRLWSGWRAVLFFVQPRTVTTWQKKRFRDYWRALSQSNKPGRPRISPELKKLIRRMWEANPTWGSPKIVAELAMLGINVAKSTVEKYQPKRAGPSSPTWRTFLDQHVRDLVSIDFFIIPTATFRVLFVFIGFCRKSGDRTHLIV